MSAVVGQAHVVHVLLTERRVVDDLLVWLGDDISGHGGRHDERRSWGDELEGKREDKRNDEWKIGQKFRSYIVLIIAAI